MTKFLTIAAVAIALVGLSACGGKDRQSSASSTYGSSTTSSGK